MREPSGGHATSGDPRPSAEPGPVRTLLVALGVCVGCACLLTSSVVFLRPFQQENLRIERERQVRRLLADLPGVSDLVSAQGEAELELQVVELATGAYETTTDLQAAQRARADPAQRVPIPPERDLAGIDWLNPHEIVYVLRRGGAVHTVILPVRGQGYLSMMRGFLALAGDGNTVRGIAFTEHQETPGLGAEIQNPAWQARWEGKRLRDADAGVRIRVVTRASRADPATAVHEVQGISGATRTGDGVTDLVRFWTGADGFGPYLERIRREGGDT